MGSSSFVNAHGEIIAAASDTSEAALVADLHHVWQFDRDRRPEMYGPIVQA